MVAVLFMRSIFNLLLSSVVSCYRALCSSVCLPEFVVFTNVCSNVAPKLFMVYYRISLVGVGEGGWESVIVVLVPNLYA